MNFGIIASWSPPARGRHSGQERPVRDSRYTAVVSGVLRPLNSPLHGMHDHLHIKQIRMFADRNPLCLAGQPASVRFVVAFGEEPLRERGRPELAAAGWVGDPGQDGHRHRDP